MVEDGVGVVELEASAVNRGFPHQPGPFDLALPPSHLIPAHIMDIDALPAAYEYF